MSGHTTGGRRGADRLDLQRVFISPLPDLRVPLEVDGPADATGAVGECTGAGARVRAGVLPDSWLSLG